jgi:hypothetical protein
VAPTLGLLAIPLKADYRAAVGQNSTKACLLLGALSALLVPASVGQGAAPKGGSWSGTTSQGRPVAFRVSGRVHRSITGLQIGTAGPPASGVKMPCSSDPSDFVDSRFRAAVSIKVGKRGNFKAKFDTQGRISSGTLNITGKFKTRKKAKGKLHWKITRSDNGRTCDSGTLAFTATKH